MPKVKPEHNPKRSAQQLSDAYYDVSSQVGFAGLSALQRYGKQLGIPPSFTKKWLEKQSSFKKFKPVTKKRFKRRQTVVDGMDEQWQADLADMQKYSGENKGFRYVLICIDVLSRYVLAAPLKSKDFLDVIAGFQRILSSSPRKPFVLQTDQGTEFLSRHFQAYLKSQNISHFYTHQSTKSSLAERVIRTIFGRLWRAMDRRGNLKWIDLLPGAVQGYNRSRHSSIGMAPDQVTYSNSQDVRRYLYHRTKTKPKSGTASQQKRAGAMARTLHEGDRKRLFNVGDRVWILDKKAGKNAFRKGYKSVWNTSQVFTIKRVARDTPPFTYKLQDNEGQSLPGQFYEEQMQFAPIED